MALVESFSKSHRWSVWSGTESDFLRLLRLVQAQFEPLLDDHVEQETARARAFVTSEEAALRRAESGFEKYGEPYAQQVETYTEDVAVAIRRLAADVERARNSGRIEIALTSRDDEVRRVTGTAEEIVQWMEGRPFESAELSAPSGRIGGRSITLRAVGRSGLSLSVGTPDDSRWGVAAFAELSAEIAKGVPAWKFVHWPWFPWFAYYITITPAVAFIVGAVARLAAPKGAEVNAILVSLVQNSISTTLVVIAAILTQRYIPKFEILSGSKRPKAAALLGAYGAALGAVALGLITNLISQTIGA